MGQNVSKQPHRSPPEHTHREEGGQTERRRQEHPAQRKTSASHSAAGDLPLLQVRHVSALQGSLQEVGELVVHRVRALQVPRCGVISDLGREQRESHCPYVLRGSPGRHSRPRDHPKAPATPWEHGAILRPNPTQPALILSMSMALSPHPKARCHDSLQSWLCLHFTDEVTEALRCLKSQSWHAPDLNLRCGHLPTPGYPYSLLVCSFNKHMPGPHYPCQTITKHPEPQGRPLRFQKSEEQLCY